jgi:uncharacterized protein (TIGR00725 family)
MTRRAVVVGVVGAGEEARSEDKETAFALGEAIAEKKWVLLSGGRNVGVMNEVNRGAKNKDPKALTIGILPGKDRKKKCSDDVDVVIATGMDNARNNIIVLSSDALVACGYSGAGTASEIALALKADKNVILLNNRPESIAFFEAIDREAIETEAKKGVRREHLVHCATNVDETIKTLAKLLPGSK